MTKNAKVIFRFLAYLVFTQVMAFILSELLIGFKLAINVYTEFGKGALYWGTHISTGMIAIIIAMAWADERR